MIFKLPCVHVTTLRRRKGNVGKERNWIINTFSILKKIKRSIFLLIFFVYINSRAYSYTVTWCDFIGICILSWKRKWWLHNLTLMLLYLLYNFHSRVIFFLNLASIKLYFIKIRPNEFQEKENLQKSRPSWI